MASNPMQRKVRNSFLLGMLVAIIIAGIAIAFLMMQLMQAKQEQQKEQKDIGTVYVLNTDKKSGDEITADDLISVDATRKTTPANALSPASLGDKNIAKIDLKSGTILSTDMIYIDETKTGKDVRKQEYNTVILPMDLATGDYIDIRLSLPSGQDYIVVSKKVVEIPQVGGVDSSDTIWIKMAEEETLAMSNAIYDAYKINGSKLYATKYTEPGIQEAATPTYAVNAETVALINGNPNILNNAMNELKNRYNANNGAVTNLRNSYINEAIKAAGEDAQSNVESGIQQSITNSQDSRKEYLNSLAGVE